MKKTIKTIYSVVIIAVFGSGYVLANYFPQYLDQLGLGWLNSHKKATMDNPVMNCQMSWDWGTGTAVVANYVDYTLTCKAKVSLKLSSTYIYISNNRGRASSTRPDSAQPFKGAKALKAGESFSSSGTLNRVKYMGGDKKARTYLVFTSDISYFGVPPVKQSEDFNPFKLFLSTGVY